MIPLPCGGHVTPPLGPHGGGPLYHYHKAADCQTIQIPGDHGPLIGYAIDGFGIYGFGDYSGMPVLDECHGHFGSVPDTEVITLLLYMIIFLNSSAYPTYLKFLLRIGKRFLKLDNLPIIICNTGGNISLPCQWSPKHGRITSQALLSRLFRPRLFRPIKGSMQLYCQ